MQVCTSYIKQADALTQAQALADLKAIATSPYFGQYTFGNAHVNSDVVVARFEGRWREGAAERATLAEVSDGIAGLLQTIEKHHTKLEDTGIDVRVPERLMRAMKFDKRLGAEDELQLPLDFHIKVQVGALYQFSIVNLGLKQSYFQEHRLNFKDACAKVANWHRQLNRQLKTLPYKGSAPEPFLAIR